MISHKQLNKIGRQWSFIRKHRSGDTIESYVKRYMNATIMIQTYPNDKDRFDDACKWWDISTGQSVMPKHEPLKIYIHADGTIHTNSWA